MNIKVIKFLVILFLVRTYREISLESLNEIKEKLYFRKNPRGFEYLSLEKTNSNINLSRLNLKRKDEEKMLIHSDKFDFVVQMNSLFL